MMIYKLISGKNEIIFLMTDYAFHYKLPACVRGPSMKARVRTDRRKPERGQSPEYVSKKTQY